MFFLQLSVDSDVDSDAEPDHPVESTPSTSTSVSGFALPRKVQQRGRPVMTRQRTFRIKQKATKTGNDTDVQPGNDSDRQQRDNCAECGRAYPPKKVCGPN